MEVRTPQNIEEKCMRQDRNQSYDQKKGSADRDVTGSRKGMPGGDIGRNSMSGSESNASRHASGKLDYGGGASDSHERKGARSGSDSSES
jgi:hypothetical protein